MFKGWITPGLTLLLAATGLTPQAFAQIPVSGSFTASQVCEATQKLSSGNQGGITTDIGQTYTLKGLNRDPATHYLIEIPGAPAPQRRWVPIACGEVTDLVAGANQGGFRFVNVSGEFTVTKSCDVLSRTDAAPDGVTIAPGDLYGLAGRDAQGTFFQISVPVGGRMRDRWVSADCGTPNLTYDAEAGIDIQPGSIEHTLAASWQPGFCATAQGVGNTGCDTITPDEPATRAFSLHGLWPDDLDTLAIFPCNCADPDGPEACSKRYEKLATVTLPGDLAARLGTAMPGSRGTLDQHEWTKHGTCYEAFETGPTAGADTTEYFEDSLLLLDQLNASPVQDLFEARRGNIVTADEIFDTFDAAFGDGAGERVQIICGPAASDGRQVIEELRIGLKGPIEPGASLSQLILTAPSRHTSTQQPPAPWARSSYGESNPASPVLVYFDTASSRS